MNPASRQIFTGKTILFGFISAVIVSAVFDLQNSTAKALPDQTPAQLYGEKCSACHNLPDPQLNAMTAEGWQRTVTRMIVQHGASDSINADQEKIILTYLDKFATGGPPKQGTPGGQANKHNTSDVWSAAPIYSHAYMFSSESAVSQLQTLSGKRAYRAGIGAAKPQLILSSFDGASGLLSAHLPTLSNGSSSPRDIQLESEFRIAPPSPGDKESQPVSFGFAFDISSPTSYRTVAYDDAKHILSIGTYNGTSLTVDQSIPVPDGLQPTPYDWHHLKLMIVGGEVKIWLDYTKYTTTSSADSNNPGDVGIWSGSRAVAKNLIVDVYSPTVSAAVQ